MYLILIAASFLGSIAFSLFLRRVSNSSIQLPRLKKTIHLHEHTLAELAKQQNQSIKDAFLDYEMLVERSQKIQGTLQQELEVYYRSLEAIANEKNAVSAVSSQLSNMAGNAGTVSRQLERLDLGMQSLDHAEKDLNAMYGKIEQIQRGIEERGVEAQKKLDATINELVLTAQKKTESIEEIASVSLKNLEEEQEALREEWRQRQDHYNNLNQELLLLEQRSDEKYNSEMQRLAGKFREAEKQYQNALKKLEDDLSDVRNASVESLQEELKLIRKDMEDFNLQSISRRDEVLSEARRMIHKAQEQTKIFQENYLEAQNHLAEANENYTKKVEESLKQREKLWSAKQEEYLQDLAQSKESIAMLKEGVQKVYRSKSEELSVFKTEIQGALEESAKSLKISMRQHAEQLLQNIQSHYNKTLQKLENNSAKLEGKGRDMLEQEYRLHENIKEVATEMEKSLKKELQVEPLLASFEEKAQAKLESLQEKVFSSMEQLDRRKEGLTREFQGFEERIETKMVEFAQEQNTAYKELKEAASSVEKDLRTRLDLSPFLAELEEAGRDKISELKENLFASMTSLDSRMEELSSKLSACQKKMELFEDGLENVDKAESFAVQLDATLEVMDAQLQEARKENANIEGYAQNFAKMRSERKEVESELRLLETQRERMNEAQRQIAQVQDQMSSLGEAKRMAVSMEERIKYFHQFKESFDHYFGDMKAKSQYIEESLGLLENSRQEVLKASQSAAKLIDNVNRTELRQQHLHDRLQQFELRANALENMQNRVDAVEARFEQMDGLMLDLEQKQKQIGSMNQRFIEFSEKGKLHIEELNSLFAEADERMDKLTSFYQVLDTMVDSRMAKEAESAPPLRNERKSREDTETLSQHKREGILSLYLNHKWEPELIAERMKLDLPLVRMVISKHAAKS